MIDFGLASWLPYKPSSNQRPSNVFILLGRTRCAVPTQETQQPNANGVTSACVPSSPEPSLSELGACFLQVSHDCLGILGETVQAHWACSVLSAAASGLSTQCTSPASAVCFKPAQVTLFSPRHHASKSTSHHQAGTNWHQPFASALRSQLVCIRLNPIPATQGSALAMPKRATQHPANTLNNEAQKQRTKQVVTKKSRKPKPKPTSYRRESTQTHTYTHAGTHK